MNGNERLWAASRGPEDIFHGLMAAGYLFLSYPLIFPKESAWSFLYQRD